MLPGVLVDGSGAALGLHDPRMIALGDYPAQAITRGFTLTTLFPQVSALAQVGRERLGGAAVPALERAELDRIPADRQHGKPRTSASTPPRAN